ncbi:AAA family ATPase [Pseudoalteromonas sp. MMG013]|uniref:ExeA family protein n=1 Tax=unclassified Pseudoalteromonas TaxID=194690 RepID=UPI001B361E03|nr:AAA family ATPase [Pseudoalteromonas sp. MMG012]MBQ4847398.1 AAA family ATPase [Pseudoalteromonas sp. MMG005]MBQ4851626.1 AAA family ATPase [Pseudoalteromonas sp. MMG012]MBQ4864449.1 AAA family ATPase [Pseudoalteromonas sp. MMG013]
MYLRYFGLNEKPFSIAPNPEYLFLSDRHKEALAHLTYGLGDAGGFVLLTGEVGTGKTTVTRSMLAQLPDSTQVAFILNPALSEMELLASICDELNIEYDADNATLKRLTDIIKARLLSNHELGGHTMLIIDEAQHLAPEVLEQLRLLTNLETDHKKLLQIVLVGQPELQQLLQRNELRQLAQRITARYHLLPLTEAQVFAYIQHRLNKAGCEASLFDHDAIAFMHKATAGIPRLLNLLADRCLLGAFSAQKMIVNKTIAQQAAQEALPLDLVPQEVAQKISLQWQVTATCALLFISGFGLSYIV